MLTAHFYSKPTNVVPDEDIFAAAVAGSLQNLSNLVKRGGRPYVRNSKNWTPSHYAAANGSIETVSSLSKYGNTNWFADDDITPVHLAARNGHTTAVKQLLKIPGHDWNRQRAVDQQASDMIKMAIGNKFARELETFFRRKTFTAQELAIIYGHVDTVLAFHVEPGSDMLHALSCACMLGNLQIVDAILYHLQNRQNYQKPESLYRQARWFPAPPLHLAVMSGNQATVALLLNQDIDSRKQAKSQSTYYLFGYLTGAYPPYSAPAHYAATVGSLEILFLLERRGAISRSGLQIPYTAFVCSRTSQRSCRRSPCQA